MSTPALPRPLSVHLTQFTESCRWDLDAQPLTAMISSLIIAAQRGESPATEALFAELYAELHRLARRELARKGVSVSVSATTLLH